MLTTLRDLIVGFFFGGVALAAGMGVTQQLSITIFNPLGIVFSPAAPSIACNAAAGTVVSTASTTGGDGQPVTWGALGGDTGDFAFNSSQQVVVGPSGIASAHCPVAPTLSTTQNVNVTATQP